MTHAQLPSPQDLENVRSPLAGKRVLIVVGPLELGGSERQAVLFARYLKNEQDVDVRIWGTMGSPGRLAALCDEYGIPWRIVPLPWVPGRINRLRELAAFAFRLRGARPEVLLPYMEMPNLVCGLVWRWTGARLCVWNQRDDGIARIRTRYETFALRNTPLFISNSAQGAEHLVKCRGVAAERVRIIHNGIELAPPEADRRTWRDRLGVREDWFAASMVANLTEFKDHATLLRAWHLVIDRLRREGRTGALLLAGRFDSTHQSLKALAYDLELGNSVRFLGQVNDVAGLLQASDIGVLCSNSEGSSNSVLEYMAAELPVAGTDIPSIREALSPESHAFLAPPKDFETLAARIGELAEDYQLRERLGVLNRGRAETEFSPQHMCNETLCAIMSALRKREAGTSVEQ